MNRWEAMKALPIGTVAQAIVFDNEGNERGCCPICQRYIEENCDDQCKICGVSEFGDEEEQ